MTFEKLNELNNLKFKIVAIDEQIASLQRIIDSEEKQTCIRYANDSKWSNSIDIDFNIDFQLEEKVDKLIRLKQSMIEQFESL